MIRAKFYEKNFRNDVFFILSLKKNVAVVIVLASATGKFRMVFHSRIMIGFSENSHEIYFIFVTRYILFYFIFCNQCHTSSITESSSCPPPLLPVR